MSGSDEHISSMGHTRQGGFSDSDDYISIESGKSVCVCVCVHTLPYKTMHCSSHIASFS